MESDPTFELFSLQHWIALVLTVASCAGCIFLRFKSLSQLQTRWGAWLLSSMLFAYGVVSYARLIMGGDFNLQTGLPLHLCDVLVIICICALLTRKHWLFEISYFFGLAGTLQTLITPNLDAGFPTFRCLIFFWMHGVILVAICFMIGAYRFSPSKGCIGRMMIAINLYVAAALLTNWLTGGNYGFLSEPPLNQENLILAISRWAPWPWYILVLEIIALASFFIYYAPWLIKDRLTRKV